MQGSPFLLFCWPLDFPSATAIKLAEFSSRLLFSILGPLSGWTQASAFGDSQARIVKNLVLGLTATHLKTPTACLMFNTVFMRR